MTRGAPRNIAASVRQRLQNLSRDRKEDFQLVLSRYALERLLHRIDQSPHRDRFVVKGAMLFHLWTDQLYRPTRDIDFLAYGDHSVDHLEMIFREVCDQAVEEDGLIFRSDTVVGAVIRPDQEYQGVRVQLEAKLERARIPVQIDVGFGDADMANSRMKDFFDLWVLAENFEFDGGQLARAIQATFERRRTSIPMTSPTALTPEFHDDNSKRTQWRAFLSRSGLTDVPPLAELISQLRIFLMPPSEAIGSSATFQGRWVPPGPWQT